MKKISFTCFLVLTFFSAQSATFIAPSPGGDWNNIATWTYTGVDADGIPDADDNVTINSGATVTVTVTGQNVLALTINSGGMLTFNNNNIFSINATSTINGSINGTLGGATHQFIINSPCTALAGTGSITITGDVFVNASTFNFSISSIINSGDIILNTSMAAGNLTNITLTAGGTVKAIAAPANWYQKSNSTLTVEAPLMPTGGTFYGFGYGTPNTVTYAGSSSYTLNNVFKYDNLTITGAGIKTFYGSALTQVDKTLTINVGAALNQSSTAQVLVNSNFVNNGTFNGNGSQQFQLNGNLTNNGTFIGGANQTFKLGGTVSQTISGTSSAIIDNLWVNNAAGIVKTSSNITLSNILTVTAGNVNNVGGNFTLKSDATKFARIHPITSGCTTCGFSGNFIIQRYIPSRSAITWADLSSPALNSTMADWDNELFFSYPHTPPTVKSNVLAYDETIGDFVGVNAATPLTAGKGFEITLTDDGTLTSFANTTLTTIGTPNYGTQTFPLSYTNNSGGYYTQCPTCYDGENLVGNPFASAINVSLISKVNTLSYIDVYNNATDNYLSLTGSIGLAPHQGFWVYATGTGASITIPESAKIYGQSFTIKSAEPLDVEPFLQLTLSSADGSNMMAHTFKVACAIDAKDGWDEKDHKFRPSLNKLAPNLTADGEMFPLSVSTFNSNDDEYTMPLSVNVGIAGKFQINSKGIEFVNKDYSCVSLEDKVLHQLVDLNATTNYVFFASPNDNKDRFALHFSKNGNCKTMTSASLADLLENQVQILPTISGNSINFNFDQTLSTNVSVTNVLGQTIVETVSLQANTQTLNIELPDGFFGMYIVKVENENGVISKKFVKK